MGKIVAIDFGLKRTGLAISDADKIFAFGLDTVASSDLAEKIRMLAQQEVLEKIVIGEPKRLDNTDTHITENVRQLKAFLERTYPTIVVELYDERFTSKMASQAIRNAGASKSQRKEKALVDKVSATLLLQDYLRSINY